MFSDRSLVPVFSLNYFCLLQLQAKHTQEGCETWGVNGETGALVDMKELGIWEPLAVKLQTYKTAVEVRMLYGIGMLLISIWPEAICVRPSLGGAVKCKSVPKDCPRNSISPSFI